MSAMNYKVFTQNEAMNGWMKIASCKYREDADRVLKGWAIGYIELNSKIIFRKGSRY